MHRVLLIPELVRLIIQYLHPASDEGFENPSASFADLSRWPPSKEATSSLARTAFSCKIFSDHALDYLWWFTNDLTPLFQLLSGFRPASNTVQASFIEGEIHAYELRRFNSYARRIRGYQMTGQERFHPSTIARILQESNQSYLLPALQCLSVDRSPVNLLPFAPLSLQHLSAINGYHVMQICPDISSLPRIPPNLRHLTLYSNLTQNSLTAIILLPHLETLSLDHQPVHKGAALNLDLSLLLRTPSADTLRKLRLGQFLRFTTLSTSWKALETLPFPALETLDITTGALTVRVLNTLLRSTVLPQLEYLGIYVPPIKRHWDNSERKHWTEFFQILPTVTSRRLATLNFACAEGRQKKNLWSSLNLSIKDIPELGLLNITSFKVAIPLFSSISNSCMEHLASCWPKLTSLHLETDLKPVPGPHAFFLLLEDLPLFKNLTMPLPSVDNIDGLESHGLCSLRITQLSTPPPEDLACDLCQSLPMLDDYMFNAVTSDLQTEWDDEVYDVLYELIKEREDIQEGDNALLEIWTRTGIVCLSKLGR